VETGMRFETLRAVWHLLRPKPQGHAQGIFNV
jgi:hypothetical protein